MINFIVNFSTLYKVTDRVWVVLMQKSFIKLLISIILSKKSDRVWATLEKTQRRIRKDRGKDIIEREFTGKK